MRASAGGLAINSNSSLIARCGRLQRARSISAAIVERMQLLGLWDLSSASAQSIDFLSISLCQCDVASLIGFEFLLNSTCSLDGARLTGFVGTGKFTWVVAGAVEVGG